MPAQRVRVQTGQGEDRVRDPNRTCSTVTLSSRDESECRSYETALITVLNVVARRVFAFSRSRPGVSVCSSADRLRMRKSKSLGYAEPSHATYTYHIQYRTCTQR